jgi:hypothetical protein
LIVKAKIIEGETGHVKKKVQKSDDSQQPKFDLCIQVLSVLLLLYDRDNACCSGVGIENQGFKLRPIYN